MTTFSIIDFFWSNSSWSPIQKKTRRKICSHICRQINYYKRNSTNFLHLHLRCPMPSNYCCSSICQAWQRTWWQAQLHVSKNILFGSFIPSTKFKEEPQLLASLNSLKICLNYYIWIRFNFRETDFKKLFACLSQEPANSLNHSNNHQFPIYLNQMYR